MKYKLLIAHTPIEFVDLVNRQIGMEWRPLGGIAICNTGADGISYYQAMEMDETVEGVEPGLIAKK